MHAELAAVPSSLYRVTRPNRVIASVRRKRSVLEMLSTASINDLAKKRAWILAPSATVGVVAMFAYLAIVGYWRDSMVELARKHAGETSPSPLPLVLIFPSLGFFLAPLVWGERRIKRYAFICPKCNTDLSRFSRRVVATRCCCFCGQQIVQGRRVHRLEAFKRLTRIEQRRFLVYWFWAWPILGLLLLGYHRVDPTGMENCRQMLFMPGLIGTVATGWAFARTMDRRYITQLFASAIVLCLGVDALW